MKKIDWKFWTPTVIATLSLLLGGFNYWHAFLYQVRSLKVVPYKIQVEQTIDDVKVSSTYVALNSGTVNELISDYTIVLVPRREDARGTNIDHIRNIEEPFASAFDMLKSGIHSRAPDTQIKVNAGQSIAINFNVTFKKSNMQYPVNDVHLLMRYIAKNGIIQTDLIWLGSFHENGHSWNQDEIYELNLL